MHGVAANQQMTMTAPRLGDLDADDVVGGLDLRALLETWGPCPEPPAACLADLDADGVVGIVDLLVLLGSWG